MPVLFINKFQTIPTLTKRKIMNQVGVWWFKDILFGSQLWLPSTKPTYILPDTTENHYRLKNVFPGDGRYVSSFPGGGYLVVGTQIFDLEKPKLAAASQAGFSFLPLWRSSSWRSSSRCQKMWKMFPFPCFFFFGGWRDFQMIHSIFKDGQFLKERKGQRYKQIDAKVILK